MEILDQLAVGLGFATLAGINLYLVTFVTGLAIRLQWVVLDERFADLQVLGNTPVLAVAGVCLLAETFADKVPWVDTFWDTVHTVIRPVGGGLLALSAIGTTQPEYDVIIALVAGGATLMSHGLKAGTRVVVNGTPEPVSNFVVSTAEDMAVIGGLALMKADPKLFAGLCIVFLFLCFILLPKIFRRVHACGWLIWRNVSRHSGDGLSPAQHSALIAQVSDPQVLWSVPVVTGRGRGLSDIRSWLVGRLVAVKGPSSRSRMFFIGKSWGRTFCTELPSDRPLVIRHEPGLLGEKLAIYDAAGTFLAQFRIPRREGEVHQRIAAALGESGPGLLPA
jgi:hypothetical protein